MDDRDQIVFRTVHGSRLYGFARPESDFDVFVVTSSRGPKACQSIADGVDTVTMGWDCFLRHAMAGSHQSAEALFSPVQEWNPACQALQPFAKGIRVCGPEVFARYERTIAAFCFGDFKRRRHGCRLALNLAGLRERGRFDPRLTPEEADRCSALAEHLSDSELLARLLPGITPQAS